MSDREVEIVKSLIDEVKQSGGVKIAPIFPDERSLPAEVGLTVVAPDWAGLVEAVAGLIHSKGYNIMYLNAFVKEQHYGVVHLRIRAESPEKLKTIKKDIEDVMFALERVASGSSSVKRVLQIGFFRMTSMLQISEALKKIVESEEDYVEITKPGGELEKFILSRTDAYIRDRKPEDLAMQVYQNFRFIRKLRSQGHGLEVDIRNEKTAQGEQTCITVAGFERNISMDDVLDEIREYIPMFKIKYDKQFVTADGIIVIRVEITDRNDNPLGQDEIELLKNRLRDWLSKRRRQRFVISNLIELVGRVLVPTLLEETRRSGMAQFYMLPEDIAKDYADFMIVLVAPVQDVAEARTMYQKLIEKINTIKGISLRSNKEPKLSNGFAIMFHWIRALTAEFKSEEEIYIRVKEAVSEIIGEFHDFDEGMRKMERKKLDEVVSELQQRRVDMAFVREFFYSMNGFERISRPARDIARMIYFGYKLLRDFFRESIAFQVVKPQNGGSTIMAGIALPVGDKRAEKFMELMGQESKSLVRIDDFGSTLIVAEFKADRSKPDQKAEIEEKIKEIFQLDVAEGHGSNSDGRVPDADEHLPESDEHALEPERHAPDVVGQAADHEERVSDDEGHSPGSDCLL